jgi:hypothetical protein
MALLGRAIGSALPGGTLAKPLRIALSAPRAAPAIRAGAVFTGAAKPGSPQGRILTESPMAAGGKRRQQRRKG